MAVKFLLTVTQLLFLFVRYKLTTINVDVIVTSLCNCLEYFILSNSHQHGTPYFLKRGLETESYNRCIWSRENACQKLACSLYW